LRVLSNIALSQSLPIIMVHEFFTNIMHLSRKSAETPSKIVVSADLRDKFWL